jgi:tetratricopeptide (TPR) repeat protein
VKITSHKLAASHLSINESALLRCHNALELRDRDDYESAREVMQPFWTQVGQHPDTVGLFPSVAAEVSLCVGILTGGIANNDKNQEAQELAKNLISEGITFYNSIGDVKKVAAARVELAYCYWRQGALDEARIILNESLEKLSTPGNTRARGLLRLAIVEWSASRLNDAMKILTDNSLLFEKIPNHAIRGAYHNQLAMVLRYLATSENRKDYLQRSVDEYQKADQEFKLAHNLVFRANVKNNVGFMLLKMARFKDAHKYLAEARRIAASIRNRIQTAEIDDTRAQVLIAENKFIEAERVARSAVSSLERSGRQCLLADTLVTHGIALARMGQLERAQSVFERAVDVAHQVGALNKAGLAALTLIEELDHAATETLCLAFDRASEWLEDSQTEDLLRRVNRAARKVFAKLHGQVDSEQAMEMLLGPSPNLHAQVLNYERTLIRHALARANGRVTRAASLLGTSYQGLAYIIGSRHKDLLTERSPVRPRARKEVL